MKHLFPTVTRNLLIINVLCWIAQWVFLRQGVYLEDLFGLHYFQAPDFRLYQVLTYQFMHSTAGLDHLLMNMFSLWLFGSTIERFWGEWRYLFFYLTCGVTAALTQEAVWWYEIGQMGLSAYEMVRVSGEVLPVTEYLNLYVTVGASGSIFGLLLAYGMLFPNSYIMLYFVLPIKAKYFVVLYGAMELFYGIKSVGNVAHFAHLGGMLGGIILILLWRKKGIIDGPYN